MKCTLVNFIIRILCHFTTTCSSVGAFETTRCSDRADFGHYEIHSLTWKIFILMILMLQVILYVQDDFNEEKGGVSCD